MRESSSRKGTTLQPEAMPEIKSANNGSETSTRQEATAPNSRKADRSSPTVKEEASAKRTQRGGGPRTELGKQRSRQNAVKDGLCAEVVLAKGESQAGYNSLLRGLRNSFKPEGAYEEFLVEKLVKNCLRQHRRDIAEAAEIRRATELFEEDRKRREEVEAARFQHFKTTPGGLIQEISNPKVLEICLQKLKQLRLRIDKTGIDPKLDKPILARIYGDYGAVVSESSLFHDYQELCCWYQSNDGGGEHEDTERTEQIEVCKLIFHRRLNDEIHRLTRYKAKLARSESKKMEIEQLCGLVPYTPKSELLLRYGTSVDRAFDQTLNQLERAQRIRKGMPVPPTLNVKLSN